MLSVIILFCLIFGAGMYFQYNLNSNQENSIQKQYQGPVLEDENLSHFSKTGERIKLENG